MTDAEQARNAGAQPDWRHVLKGTAHRWRGDEQDMIAVTKETLRLALAALRTVNDDDYYHHNGVAEREISEALHQSYAIRARAEEIKA